MMARRSVCVLLVIALLAAPVGVTADERQKIATLNVAAQAGLTVFSAAVQRKIRGRRDLLRCLWAGAASGVGVYQGKSLIGKGHVATGWIVANLAGSLSENAAAGKHPFAQLGYSFGPIRIRVSLPSLDKASDSLTHVDVSAFETFALIAGAVDNDRMELRSGAIVFRRDTPYTRNNQIAGVSYGMFPGLFATDKITWHHEMVHAAQFLQLDVVEPSFGWLSFARVREPGAPRKIVRFEHVKIGVLNLVDLGILASQPYHRRWVEIEAYRLAENTSPPVK